MLCCTLGVDSSFAQVLGGPLCSFSKNSFIHLLAYSCFTLLCQFLLYSKVNQSSIYLSIYVSVSLLDFLPVYFTTEH